MSELQEVDIEKELKKSDNEDVPTLSIQTETLDENIEDEQLPIEQKELLASLIQGSPEKEKEEEEDKSSPVDSQTHPVSDTNISLEIGEIPDEELNKSPPEEGEIDETTLNITPPEELNKSPPEEGEIDETTLNITPPEELSKSPLEEGEIDESTFNVIDVDESSDEEEENLFYRNLEEDIDTNILKFYHPETENINYKELLTLSNITKNKKGEIIDSFHKTIPFLTQYEKAKILGQRAKQINHGSTPFVDVPSNIIDGHTIALMELNQKKIPFIIRRPLPNGTSEYWKVKDLKIIH
jgi:DNA-directed RNA polymerases I, II, and III subunit RPABC2